MMKTTNAAIRRLKPDDLKEIEDIENAVWSEPWTAKQFRNCMKRCAGLVAVIADVGVVGFAISRSSPTSTLVLRMAVHPSGHREGIGSQLLRAIQSEAQVVGRDCVEITVHERNVSGQQFLKANQFRFRDVLRKDGWQCDEYLMRWHVGGFVDQSPANRGDCEDLANVAGVWPASGW